MAYKNRFHKTTLGVDAQVLVAKAVEYTDDATYADFVANAVEGEIAVINAATNAVLPGPGVAAVAAAVGTEVFIALKRDGNVEKTLPFKLGTALIKKLAYVAPVKHVVTVTSVAAPAAPVKGDQYEIGIIETTPGLLPLPTYNYTVEAKAGETYVDVLTRLVALVNNAQAIENQDRYMIVDAAIANVDDITITAKRIGEHFTVVVRGKLGENASAAVTTQFKLGSGTPEQALLAEQAGDIRKGVTTNYPHCDATPEEFGKPTSFVDASAQYGIFVVEHTREDVTRTLDKETRKCYEFVYVPSNGAANAYAELGTILGV